MPRIGPGRPRTRPDHVPGDKGYSSKVIRARLRHRGIPHTIPEPGQNRPASRSGRHPRITPDVGVEADEPTQSSSSSMLSDPERINAEKLGYFVGLPYFGANS